MNEGTKGSSKGGRQVSTSGRMLKEMPKNEGGGDRQSEAYKQGKTTCPKNGQVVNEPPTYSELGVDKRDASIWQFMAKHEDETETCDTP